MGEQENAWLAEALADLRDKNPEVCLASGEMKGAALTNRVVCATGHRIKDEDHRVLFWANWYPQPTGLEITALADRFLESIRGLHAGRERLDRPHIDARYRKMADYLVRLKRVNLHKVISSIAHCQWLTVELKRVGLGSQLRMVDVVVDREDLPSPTDCADFLKLQIAAMLQAAGMSVRLTGKALREHHDEGAVRVDVHSDSRHFPGLQVVDILLQAVQRKLPGYVGVKKLSNKIGPANASQPFRSETNRTSPAAGSRR